MALKIFISHSAADEPLSSALVDCLMSSMVLDDDELRCTSVAGHKLPVGSDFASTLLRDIGDSAVVIGLITKNAIASSWVMFELGATWGAQKNMKPLVTGEVDLANLPGPISARHVAKMASSTDVSQFLEEVIELIGAKRRSSAKTNKAIDSLLAAHTLHTEKQLAIPTTGKVETAKKEPIFSGLPFSELMEILRKEEIHVPSHLNNGKGDVDIPLFDLFISNAATLSDGVRSDFDAGTPGKFLYSEIALKLLPYGLVSFEKLPVAQARRYKRITVSPEGHKFVLNCKRLAKN